MGGAMALVSKLGIAHSAGESQLPQGGLRQDRGRESRRQNEPRENEPPHSWGA
jgi:hypothetical protein